MAHDWGCCPEHNIPLQLVSAATMSSPAEWGCPVCDGAFTVEEWERHKQHDEDDEGDARYHRMKEDGEL